jgi:hypothetical protein
MRRWGVSDHPRDCPHGRQWGKCDTCDLIEANKRIAALEAENERLNQLSVDLRACMVEARHKLGLEQDKNDELRAVVEAARWVTPYIPEVGEETYCHPMHHGYHNGQFHTVYVTTREQEQFGKWAENFVDALAALDEEVGE